MHRALGHARPHVRSVLALAAILGVLVAMLGPTVSPGERTALARQFQFVRQIIPSPGALSTRRVRPVNPSLSGIQGWISSVGAAIALVDINGTGLSNDICLVDPRTDQVVVEPAPGTGNRYSSFTLAPPRLPTGDDATAPMGCLGADVNEDGLLDLVVYYWGRTPIAFIRHPGPPSTSTFEPVELVPGGLRWYSNAATFADIDGDGHPDLVVGNYFPDGARILDSTSSTGESMQASMSRAYNGGGVHMLLWRPPAGGRPRFDLATLDLPDAVGHGWTLAVGAADLDGDGLPELYLANDFGPDRLLWNRSAPGRVRLQVVEGQLSPLTPPSSVLGHDSFKGMGIDFADLEGAGRLDMFVSNITSEFALQESNFVWVSQGASGKWTDGIAPYRNASEDLGLSRSGWGWDVKMADFANSGRPQIVQAVGFLHGTTNRWPELQELAMGNVDLLAHPELWPRFADDADLSGGQHDPFFVRAQSGKYADIAAEIGLREAAPSRGIAIADVDGSGRLSFAVANQWADSTFYRNTCVCGEYLELRLLLPLTNEPTTVRDGHDPIGFPTRAAIGASVRVHLPDGRTAVSFVDGGNGHSGKRSTDVHFGLGGIDAAQLLSVDVAWRDGVGKPHTRTFVLRPGWHTVVLGGEDQ